MPASQPMVIVRPPPAAPASSPSGRCRTAPRTAPTCPARSSPCQRRGGRRRGHDGLLACRSSTTCSAASRSAAGPEGGDLARPLEVDAAPAPVACGARATGCRRGHRSPAAGRRARADRSPSSPPADLTAASAVRVRLVRPAAEPLERLEPRLQLPDGPDARQVREEPGTSTVSSSGRGRRRRRRPPCHVRARDPPAGRPHGAHLTAAPPLHPDEPTIPGQETPARPAVGHAADPVVVGRRAPQRQRRRRRPRGVG